MDNNLDNLKKLIDRIRTVGLLDRIFGWQKVKDLLLDAIADLQKTTIATETFISQILELKTKESGLLKDYDIAKTSILNQLNEIDNLKNTVQHQNDLINNLNSEITEMGTRIKMQDQTVNKLEYSNGLLTQQNEHLSKSFQKLSEENATEKETLVQITKAKNKLETDYLMQRQNSEQLISANKILSQENATSKEALTQTAKNKSKLENDLADLNSTIKYLRAECDQLKNQNTQLITEEEQRRTKFDNDVSTLNSIREQIQTDRNAELELRNFAEIERIKAMKDTWGKHQDNVKSILKGICSKHFIEYIDKVSFKLEPDNTLKICDEYVVFDAKSPGSDDLKNFPSYLKEQTERAKKYAKQDGVKKDIFFVVPSNTLEKLTQFVYNLVDYDVYIISIDSLEQIILSLKKIESYDLAEALRPEDRDNICRVLGKFAHLSKRRIQIDSFFAKQFMELAYKSENDLPKEIFDQTVKYEKSEKLNPPIERRAKAIPIKDLQNDADQLQLEVTSKGILIDDVKLAHGLNELQLYQKMGDQLL